MNFKFIPHLLTSLNLFSGVLAVLVILSPDNQIFESWGPFGGKFHIAAYLVMFAGLMDFLDGFAARLLKVDGDFGKQLDSLADVLTFGLVPGLFLYAVMIQTREWPLQQDFPTALLIFPLLIPVFSALRLAKFNIDTEQSSSFKGLPTPANAFWIIGLPFLMSLWSEMTLLNAYTLAGWSILSCLLLVSNIPLMALKVKGFGWKENSTRYIFLGICLILLVVLKFAALSIIIPFYILYSLLLNLLRS